MIIKLFYSVLFTILFFFLPFRTEASCVTLEDITFQDLDSGERLYNIKSDVELCPTTYGVDGIRFKILSSNITLDCGSNTFDGYMSKKNDYVSRALDTVDSLENVTIKNCNFKNYQRGFILTPATIGITASSYATGLKNFTIRNVNIEAIHGGNSGYGEGIVIGPYSQDFTIENSTVKNTKLSGLYLEAYSVRTKVINSIFIHNGFSDSKMGREAIAIDASSENIIAGNTFIDNKYAAITTYKNCGESNTKREMHANRNLIENNIFKYHDNYSGGAAIVIASRQALQISGCSDDTIPGRKGYFFDYSKYNVIRNNSFINNITSIKIMDSYQSIIGNTFHGTNWSDLDNTSSTHQAVYDVAIGNAILSEINSPVIGISILNNITRTNTTNSSGRTFVPNHDSIAHFSGNMDAYYRCLSDSQAAGNTCEEVMAISNRCEISATKCPARSSYLNAPDFPKFWLDTTYGSNVRMDICAARAKQLWDWCNLNDGTQYSISSRFVRNNVIIGEQSVYSGP